MIRSAVITAAGLGTRLLPYTKEVPKEMLPLIIKRGNNIVVVPVLHYIFEALYEIGVRRFYFVVGRGKRAVEDYFAPDKNYVDYLKGVKKYRYAELLEDFYNRVEECEIVMINQPSPKGFGDAVLRVEPFMTDEVFFVHAGDDIIYPNHVENLKMLRDCFSKYRPKATLLHEFSETPEKYGVIVGYRRDDYLEIRDIIEKPIKPPSNCVVVAIYIFNRIIFEALEATKTDTGEHQLTDAIRYLVKKGEPVYSIRVKGNRLDLGSPSSYFYALKNIVNELGGNNV